MDTQANEPIQDLLLDDIIGDPISLKLSILETITKHFSEDQIIGSGAYGTVYKVIKILFLKRVCKISITIYNS